MKKEKKHVPNEPWTIKYDPCVYKNTKKTTGALFSPQQSKNRKTTYNKVNETDY